MHSRDSWAQHFGCHGLKLGRARPPGNWIFLTQVLVVKQAYKCIPRRFPTSA